MVGPLQAFFFNALYFFNRAAGLDDMADIFPAEGNSLAQIYDWPKSQEKQFDKAFEGFCFEVQKKTDCQSLTDVVPLKPNGSNIKLTYATRQVR